MSTYPNLDELCTRDILLSKGINIKRERLRMILKRIKQSQPITILAIYYRQYQTRTVNTMWHLDSVYKLINW